MFNNTVMKNVMDKNSMGKNAMKKNVIEKYNGKNAMQNDAKYNKLCKITQ